MQSQDAIEASNPITILLVDHREIYLHALSNLLEQFDDLQVVAKARNADEARRYALGHSPMVAILAECPDPSSGDFQWGAQEVMDSISSSSADTATVILADGRNNRQMQDLLNGGARGLVHAEQDPEQIKRAIMSAAKGEAYVPPSLILDLVKGNNEEQLTDRQHDVLCGLALGFTNAELAKRMHLSVRTIESHRTEVYHRLGLHNRAEIVRYALDHDMIR